MEECNRSQTVQHLTFVCLVGQSILWIVSRTGFTGQSLSPLLICPRYVSPRKKILKKAWNCHNQGQEWRDDEHHGCWMLSDSVAKGWTLSSSIYCPILNPITAEPTAVDFNLSGNIFSLIQRFMEKKWPVAKGQIIDGHSFFFLLYFACTRCAFSVTWLLNLASPSIFILTFQSKWVKCVI